MSGSTWTTTVPPTALAVSSARFTRALAPVEHPIWKKLVRSEETPVRHSDRREITWIIGHKHSESLIEPSWDCAAQKANEPHSVVEFDMREFVRGNDLVNATRRENEGEIEKGLTSGVTSTDVPVASLAGTDESARIAFKLP